MHGCSASTIIQFMLETRSDDVDRDVDRIRLGYATMCRYVETFVSAALKEEGGSRELVPVVPGVPDGVVTIERRHPPSVGSIPQLPKRSMASAIWFGSSTRDLSKR